MGFTKLIGVRQNMISDKGDVGLDNFLFFLTRVGRVSSFIFIFGGQRGGGVWTPPSVADIISEHPFKESINPI